MGMMHGNHQRSAARPRLSAGGLGSSRTGDGISGGVWGWPDASRRVSLGNPGSDLAHNPNLNSPKPVRFRPGISKPVDVSNWAHGPRHLSWRTSFAVMIVCVNPTMPAWAQRDRARCAAPSVRASGDRNETHPSEAQANHQTAPYSRHPTSPLPPGQP